MAETSNTLTNKENVVNVETPDRQKEIHEKGFNILQGDGLTAYNKIKIGQILEEKVAYLLNTDYKKVNPKFHDREFILRALNNYDLKTLRAVSEYFYRISGIYSRLIKYLAFTYNYDWIVTPVMGVGKVSEQKILDDYNKCLYILDKFGIKKNLGQIALLVLKNGCYYGYLIEQPDKTFILQELPIDYCRSRYNIDGKPAVEFNMKYFDANFRDEEYRKKILDLYPAEIKQAYNKYKKGTLISDYKGDEKGWVVLDYTKTVKFNLNSDDIPMLMSLIPLIIDLEAAQNLDKQKTAQRLVKLIIQHLPLDKNGELLFDLEEAREIHRNALDMVGTVTGTEVLTSFADVSVEDMDGDSDKQDDDLARVERQLYNEAGVSQMLFNTDGNLALERSMLNDAATMKDLVYQFEEFLNLMTARFSNPKKVVYKVQILPTTIYNYKDMSKLYKEQAQLGFSLMLPQISLGVSQANLVSNLKFENQILKLPELLTPPLSSNTATSKDIKGGDGNKSGGQGDTTVKNKTTVKTETKQVGRPKKPDEEKSEKTAANEESQG